MVGGSVNGHPFREDPTSYSRTGIPCGNPKRFSSRGVVRMVPNSRVAFEDQRLDAPPTEKMETEGERQFKRLLDKQLNKETSVAEVMKQSRTFRKSLAYQPLTEHISGEFSLGEFRTLEGKKEKLDELQQCGLDPEEIKLHLLNSIDKVENRAKGKMNPQIMQERLKTINDKIQQQKEEVNKPSPFRDLLCVSRHEMEIESSLKPNSSQAHFFQKLMTTTKAAVDDLHPDNPLNHLKQMESEMFGPLQEGKRKRRLRKRRERQEQMEKLAAADREACVASCDERIKRPQSEDDDATSRKIGKRTVEEKDAILMDITVDEIVGNRMSVDEIRKLPRFSSYSAGTPSRVLYVKNLAKVLEESELQGLFSLFSGDGAESPEVKLMQGKMRGQAFVTFSDQELASKALEVVNGFILKGKPMVISFGRHE